MRGWKCWLWLIALPYCAASFAAPAEPPANKTPLKLDTNTITPSAASPAARTDPASLAKTYEAGTKAYKEGDIAGAMALLRPAADAGHALSQAFLGYILDQSSFFDEAAAYYRKSADQGCAAGQFGLGVMYAEGSGVKQNFAEARRLLILASEQGHKQAVNVMASAYINGGLGLDDAAREKPEALSWIKRSAENDNLPAIDALAVAYQTGQYGLTPDPKKAEALIAKANKMRGITKKKSKQ